MNSGLSRLFTEESIASEIPYSHLSGRWAKNPTYDNIGLMETVLHDRIAYRKAASEEAGVHELQTPDSKAKNEIALLYGEIYDG